MPKKPTTTTTTAKTAQKGKKVQKPKNPLFERKPKNFGIGQDLRKKKDLWRFVRWPKYIDRQRKRRIISGRLKVPPALNQFTRTLDKSSATALFKLLGKYRPETRLQKKQRLLKAAEAKSKGEAAPAPTRPNTVQFGFNQITRLVEQKRAKFVAIAHDVEPVETVMFLPTLCRKLNVPYCIVKGKSRLGAVVHRDNVAAVALTNVDKEDQKDLANVTEHFLQSFNNNVDLRRTWGGGIMGNKALAAKRKKEKALAKEQAAKMNA